MKINKLKTLILLMILIFSSSCVKTHYEYHNFAGGRLMEQNKQDYVIGYIPINNSINEYKKIGFLKDKLVYKEPFCHYFKIYGNFEKIENLEAYFIQNKKKKIPILINTYDINKNRKEYSNDDVDLNKINGYKFLYTHEKLTTPIIWDETDSLEVLVKFIGIYKNGNKQNYELKGTYQKKSDIKNVNLTWEAIMGI